jgi:hypothetical protein
MASSLVVREGPWVTSRMMFKGRTQAVTKQAKATGTVQIFGLTGALI